MAAEHKTSSDHAKTNGDTVKAAADKARTTMEPFATAGAKAFRESMEKSMAAMSEINAHSKKNLDAVVASATAAAKTLAGAKSFQEVFELQTAYAKKAFEGYVAEAGVIAETVAASMKESFSPLNERVTALVERAQTTR